MELLEPTYTGNFSLLSYPKRHRGRSWWMHRRFTNFDVDTTATPLPEPIELTQNEDIHYEDGVLQCANGTINLWIPLRPHRRPRPGGQSVQDSMMGKEPDIMNRPKRGRVPFGIRARRPTLKPALYIGLHRFSITSKYTLELVSCSSETDVVARRKREIENSQRDEYLSSSLYTSIDHGKKVIYHDKIHKIHYHAYTYTFSGSKEGTATRIEGNHIISTANSGIYPQTSTGY